MLQSIIKKYVLFSHSFAVSLLILLLLLFVAEFYFVKHNFVLDSDLVALFDGDSDSIKDLNTVIDRLGSFETLTVVAHSDSVENNKAVLKQLAEKLKSSPLIANIEFHRDVTYLEEHALLYMPVADLKKNYKQLQAKIAEQVQKQLSIDDDADQNKKIKKPQDALSKEINTMLSKIEQKKKQYDISPYFIAENGAFVAMKVKPAGSATSIKQLKKIMAVVQKGIDEIHPEKNGVAVELGGPLLKKVDEISSMNKDLTVTLAVCILLLSLVIIWYFRSFLALLIVMLPLSAGILSAVALAAAILPSFNIVSAFSFVILYGLGIDFGIHLLSRYGEEREKGEGVLSAMQRSGENVVPSLVSGAITTAAAFMTIYFIDFKGFSDYGLVAVLGILGSLIAFILFFPVLVFVLERIRPLQIHPRKITVLEHIYLFLLPRKKVVLWIVAVVTLVSAAAFFDIPFEYDLKKLSFDQSKSEFSHSLVHQYEKAVKKEQRDAFSRGRVSVFMTDSQEEANKLAEKLMDMQKKGEGGNRIEAVVSMRKFVPQNQSEKLHIIKKMKRLIERKINMLNDKDRALVEKDIMPILSTVTPVEQGKLPHWIAASLKEQDGSIGKFVLLLLSGNYQDMQNVTEIKEQFGVIKVDGNEYHMAAPYLLLADISDVIHKDVPLMALYAILAVILTLLIMFRSLKYMLELLLPLLIALVLMFGAVWVLNIKLNLFNLIIVPTMLGTGIDSSIHIFHRFLSFDKNKKQIPYILNHTGGAVLFSSITTLVGFASLMISAHQGMVSIGAIASIGIISATAVNLLIFPLLMRGESHK